MAIEETSSRISPTQRRASLIDAREDVTDAKLVAAWQNGDLSSASIAIQRYQRLVFATALRYVDDRPVAEDVTQETFLRAHERIHDLRNPAALPGWLKQVCVRLSIDHLRRERPAHLEAADETDPGLGPLEQVELQDVLGRFRAALAELPPAQRVVVLLRDVEGLGTAEAAELLEISEGAVKMRLSRARAALRRGITDQ